MGGKYGCDFFVAILWEHLSKLGLFLQAFYECQLEITVIRGHIPHCAASAVEGAVAAKA